MPETYDLARMLEEIIEDEKVSTSKGRRISQEEIKKMLAERRNKISQPRDMTKISLGESLLKEGLITPDQLEIALMVQSNKGAKIGSILLEMGFISENQLLQFLAGQYGIQSTNLMNANINENVIGLLPSRIILKHRVLPLKIEGSAINLAMENPGDSEAIHEVEFFTGKRVNPVIVPSHQLDLAIKCIATRGKSGSFFGTEIRQALHGSMTVQNVLEYLVTEKGSDVLITAGAPPAIKVNNTLKHFGMPPLNSEQCVACAKALMTETQWEDFLKKKEIEFAFNYENKWRFRVSAYRQKNTVSLAIRRILGTGFSFAALGLPQWLEEYIFRPQGFIIVASPSGQGRTTSLAAMVDLINKKRKCNIITLEDPVEYLHESQMSSISQREVGTDTESFAKGLGSMSKHAPDVMVISDIPDQESLLAALSAACAGHLVLCAVLASSATSAIDNLLGRVSRHLQTQAAHQLAEVLQLVFAQRLLTARNGDTLVMAYERLVNSNRIRELIRGNRLYEISARCDWQMDEYTSLDVHLVKLFQEGKITKQEALRFAADREFVEAGPY